MSKNSNEKITVFGGVIFTGGVMKDSNGQNREWRGANVMLADCIDGSYPMKAFIVKCSLTDDLKDALSSLAPGTPVKCNYTIDSNGMARLCEIRPLS